MTRCKEQRREEGIALVIAILCVLVLMALGSGLLLAVSSETLVAANYRDAMEGAYAADAAAGLALADLLAAGDWNEVLAGVVRPTFVDGPPSGTRTTPGGPTIDLGQAVNRANCGRVSACTAADMDAVTTERPWGPNNPRWQPYVYGRLEDMLPAGTIVSPYYVLVFVADDPAENDNDPLRDGTDPLVNAGSGVLAVRAESFGPRGAHKVRELMLARTAAGGEVRVRVLSWREPR